MSYLHFVDTNGKVPREPTTRAGKGHYDAVAVFLSTATAGNAVYGTAATVDRILAGRDAE